MLASHKRTVPSQLPLVIVVPSGLNATLLIQPVCPVSVLRSVPVLASHKRTMPSLPPLAIVVPLGLNATLLTELVCPPISANSTPVCASYIQIPTPPPTASRLPSGEYAICSILPLPRRARTPSGKFHCGESWAKVLFKKNRVVKQMTMNIERNRVFIKSPFVYGAAFASNSP